MRYISLLLLALALYSCESCTPEPQNPCPNCGAGVNLTNIPYAPVAYNLNTNIPRGASVVGGSNAYPSLLVPDSNAMTVAGVQLGRYLFYEKKLSYNNTQSCGSCHKQANAFSDPRTKSVGADGASLGTRNSMSLVNIGFVYSPDRQNAGLMWDGRHAILEQQILEPVSVHFEMNSNWNDVETMLRNDTMYQRRFRQAFGIPNSNEITRYLAAKAIAQFLRSMVAFNSKYDRVVLQNSFEEFSESEDRGRLLFFTQNPPAGQRKGECFHCHGGHRLSGDGFFNNGLTFSPAGSNNSGFPDRGLGAVTNRPSDNGKFRSPTLRNIALTAPYMHDGRFATLEEVLDHYVDHIQRADNIDINLLPNPNINNGLQALTTQDKQDIVAFLNTLTDNSVTTRPEWSDPF